MNLFILKKNINYILLIAFIIRFLLLIIHTYFFTLPQGDADAVRFEKNAYYLSISNYQIDWFTHLTQGDKLYELLLSFVYLISGRNPFLLGLIMVFLGVYVVYLTYQATFYLWQNDSLAEIAAWITTFCPLLALESAILLREKPIMVFMMLGIISFIKFMKYKKNMQIIGFILYTFLALLFHSGIIAIYFGYLFYISFIAKQSNFLTKFLSVVLVLGALYLMNETKVGTNKIGGSLEKSFETLQKREQYDTRGGSRYPQWMRLSGDNSDIIKIPIRFITFLFSPLIPWLIRSIWHLVGVIDALLYIVMFYLIFRYREIFKYNETAKALFIMALVTIFVFSLGVTNVGTAVRHRAKIAPILIVLAVGMNKKMLNYYRWQLYEYLKQFKKSSKNKLIQ